MNKIGRVNLLCLVDYISGLSTGQPFYSRIHHRCSYGSEYHARYGSGRQDYGIYTGDAAQDQSSGGCAQRSADGDGNGIHAENRQNPSCSQPEYHGDGHVHKAVCAQKQIDEAGQNADFDISLKAETGCDAHGKRGGQLELAARYETGKLEHSHYRQYCGQQRGDGYFSGLLSGFHRHLYARIQDGFRYLLIIAEEKGNVNQDNE